MTDILFINPTEELSLRQEVNGTLLLATKLLRAGFHAEVLRFAQITHKTQNYSAFIEEITERILEFSPRCVSFYTLWPSYHIMLRIAFEVKNRSPETTIIMGGPQASATAKATMDAMPFIDYICTGEGETTIVPLLSAILRKDHSISSIPGLYRREHGIVVFQNSDIPLCDLNTLPHWDPQLYRCYDPASESNIGSATYFMPIDAGRGCPFNCSFCCTSYFWKRTYRLKSPERIVDDIVYHQKTFGINSFWFSHDAFTTNNSLVSQVCDSILEKKLKIQWRCTARIDHITEDLIIKMKQAGLTQIELGIESGSARMQKIIHKNLNLQRARKMIDFLLKQKIRVTLFFMYGFPEETEQDLSETLELLFSLLDAGVSQVSMSFCRFNPQTAITEQCYNHLVLDPGIGELRRNIDGYQNEFQMIQSNKALFPFLYHLHTPVRDGYAHLSLFVQIYQRFPRSMPYIRSLYHGDNLNFYRDFYESNSVFLSSRFDELTQNPQQYFLDLIDNMLKNSNLTYPAHLHDVLRLEHVANLVHRSDTDISIRDKYGFNFFEFKLKIPIDAYSSGETEILVQKINDKVELKVLSVH